MDEGEHHMNNTHELAVTEVKETAPLTAQEIKSQVQLIQEVMQVAETYRVTELKELKQKDVNALLEWLEMQHEKRIEAAERQSAAVEN
jgi:Cu2+-containing amine oxidase